MKFKKLVLFFLVLSMLVCTCGCASQIDENREYEYDDFIYYYVENSYNVLELSDSGRSSEILYVCDEVDGLRVCGIGSYVPIMYSQSIADFKSDNLKKIYFPWSIKQGADRLVVSDYNICIISASTYEFVMYGFGYDSSTFVIPNFSYENGIESKGVNFTDVKGLKHIIPANIAYFFNYEENPNEGYFFVDLLEESGKLTKPPYDPKRSGYKFAGWYKEAECVNAWGFENDIVEINFDEEGNRIYEEICLYAKWVKK